MIAARKPMKSMRPQRRRNLPTQRARSGMAAIEVVIVTGMIVPALITMLYFGMKLMAAFFSLAGTMMGSAIG